MLPVEARLPRFAAKLLVITTLLILSGCGDEPDRIPEPRLIEAITIGTGEPDQQRRFPAELRGVQRASLGFEIPGMVRSVNVDLGQRFRQGQVLARLDPAQQSLGVEAARAAVREADAVLREAQLDYDRKAALDGTGAVAGAVIDAARSRLETAQARKASLQAEAGRARDLLGDTALRAPYSGEVTRRLAEPSQVLMAGQPVMEVVGLNRGLEAVIQMPSRFRSRLAIGQTAEFRATGGDTVYTARITEIAGGAGANGLYEVSLAVPAAARDGLNAGEQGEVFLPTRSAENEEPTVMIPLGSWYGGDGTAAYVMLIDSETETVARRKVRLGEISDAGATVRAGLESGDRIVARGAAQLKDGETVRITGDGPSRFND